MINRNKHSASVTIELAIGVALAVSVLFVILGLFNNNLKNMIVNTNLSNVFKNNDVKTAFTVFNKDYSNSQINVQIMGEQGLARLRKKANNLALTLIESPFNNSNTNGSTIKYLSLAIQTIVGNGNICVYMKKDSDKLCSDSEIGGYSYNINSSGTSALTIQKVDLTGNNILATATLPLSATNGTITSSLFLNTNTNSLTVEQKYSALQALTNACKAYIPADAALVRDVAPALRAALEVKGLKTDVGALLDAVVYKASLNVNKRVGDGDAILDDTDLAKIKAWAEQSKLNINNTTTRTKSAIASIISGSFNPDSNVYRSESGTRVFRLTYDRSQVPCQTLVQGLVNLAQKYNLNNSDFGISEITIPSFRGSNTNYYTVPSGKYICGVKK